MKIAVLSDIHDNIWGLEKVLKRVRKEKCEVIIFCGDYCSPSTFKMLAEFGLPLSAVFGNVDGAHYEIMRAIQENKYQVKQEKDFLKVECDGRKIALCHKPEFAEGLASSGKYDVVFYGHTHEVRQKKVGKTLLANPGEVHGSFGKCTFGIYDTITGKFKIMEVK